MRRTGSNPRMTSNMYPRPRMDNNFRPSGHRFAQQNFSKIANDPLISQNKNAIFSTGYSTHQGPGSFYDNKYPLASDNPSKRPSYNPA